MNIPLSYLRKTFVTHYARGKGKDGRERELFLVGAIKNEA